MRVNFLVRTLTSFAWWHFCVKCMNQVASELFSGPHQISFSEFMSHGCNFQPFTPTLSATMQSVTPITYRTA